MNETKDLMCEFCWIPLKDHPQCPDCGYTYCDAKFQMDHRLCGRPEPLPPKGIKSLYSHDIPEKP